MFFFSSSLCACVCVCARNNEQVVRRAKGLEHIYTYETPFPSVRIYPVRTPVSHIYSHLDRHLGRRKVTTRDCVSHTDCPT